MKTKFTFLIFTLTFSCFSQTQLEMNTEAYEEFNKADRELNEVYKSVLQEYEVDTTFVKSLKNAQRLWIKFRDAELEMKYPKYEKSYYGSTHPMCRSFYLKELTEKRTEKLKIWLTGNIEGDMCSGSVKTSKLERP